MADIIKSATATVDADGNDYVTIDFGVGRDGLHCPPGTGAEIAARLLRPTDALAFRPMGDDLAPLLARLIEAVTDLTVVGVKATPNPLPETVARDDEHWRRTTESHAAYMRNAAEHVTRRDFMAAAATTGLLANGVEGTDDETADRAYRHADAMIDARTREVKPPKFANTSCSQCGASFGPGDSVYSHCDDHRSRT